MRRAVWFLLALPCAYAQDVTPYTLTEVSRLFDAGGNPASESRFLVAVNREGSLVTVDLDPSAGGVRQILDFVRGQTIVVNPASRSVSRFSYRPQRSSGPCEKRFFSFSRHDGRVTVENPAGTIEGVPVQRVSVDWLNGRGMDVLMAPSLGCQMLRVLTRENGRVQEIRVARELRLGDPDPALFQIPADYREIVEDRGAVPGRR